MRGMSPEIAWTFDPLALLGVVVFAAIYLAAWRLARVRGERHRPGWGRMAVYAGGLVAIVAALASPIDKLGEQLLVMHMLQHILLLDVAPILMILGLTKVLLRPATRRLQAVERRVGWLSHPAVAVLLYAGFMWLWHIPRMYDLALNHEWIHALEHACFFAAGALYWWYVFSPIRSRQRLRGLGPIMYMVSTKLLVGLLGIVLAFAPHSIYPYYQHQPRYWHLSAQEDQSLGGLAMTLEQSIVMGIALVGLFVQMLTESEQEAQRQERFELASPL
jgi:cytochrome c oxidase assembly factor CtaG